jgi:hypothetical protein
MKSDNTILANGKTYSMPAGATAACSFGVLFAVTAVGDSGVISGIDEKSISRLQHVVDEGLAWAANSNLTIGVLMGSANLDELDQAEQSSLGWLFAGLAELQVLLLDANVVLSNTREDLTKKGGDQ